MQYKTIVLHLLEQNPELYDRFRRQRKMLPTLEYYARELKTLHEAWKEVLVQMKPESAESQIASEGLELALDDLQARLPTASTLDGNQEVSLDTIMDYLRRHSPRA